MRSTVSLNHGLQLQALQLNGNPDMSCPRELTFYIFQSRSVAYLTVYSDIFNILNTEVLQIFCECCGYFKMPKKFCAHNCVQLIEKCYLIINKYLIPDIIYAKQTLEIGISTLVYALQLSEAAIVKEFKSIISLTSSI